MNLAKNTIFILLALFIDGLQAAISWGIAMIAAFPGNTAGGTVGCVVGNEVAGSIGCWVGGGVLAFFGTALNPILAPATIPIGIALGFAINVCLSIVLGWFFLVPLMFFFGIRPQRQLPWGLGEIIPGLNNIPFWTALTIASLWKGAATKKERKGILGLAGVTVLPTQKIMATKEATGMLASQGARGWTPQPEEWAPQPTTGKELVRTAQQRTPLHDIRPAKPNAQAA